LKHQHEIEKKNMVPLPEELPRKVILINKKNIKYLVVDA
jgi:hypothetical protein